MQFAVSPHDGRLLVIEMNPRVSRSSALASKATGFPIAKIAAKLAVGYTLDELKNDITGGSTPASFEPSIDYVVTKIPRFTFEKFPMANDRLTTQMKSVGEVMAIGRTFQESLQKALRGLETGLDGLSPIMSMPLTDEGADKVAHELRAPGPDRLLFVADAFRAGWTAARIHELSHIDPWFLAQVEDLVAEEAVVRASGLGALTAERLREPAQGLPTASPSGRYAQKAVRDKAPRTERRPGTSASTPARPSSPPPLPTCPTHECARRPQQAAQDHDPGRRTEPHRPGDRVRLLLCARRAAAGREDGFETIMVNCNPGTVSTDYDTSDRLLLEPSRSRTCSRIAKERPEG